MRDSDVQREIDNMTYRRTFSVELIKENEDGSADYKFDLLPAEIEALTRLGIITAMKAGLEKAEELNPKKGNDMKMTIDLEPEALDQLVVQELTKTLLYFEADLQSYLDNESFVAVYETEPIPDIIEISKSIDALKRVIDWYSVPTPK